MNSNKQIHIFSGSFPVQEPVLYFLWGILIPSLATISGGPSFEVVDPISMTLQDLRFQ